MANADDRLTALDAFFCRMTKPQVVESETGRRVRPPLLVPVLDWTRGVDRPDSTGVHAAVELRKQARQRPDRFTGVPGLVPDPLVPFAIGPDCPHTVEQLYYSVPDAARHLLTHTYLNSVARHLLDPELPGYIDVGAAPFVPEMTALVRQLRRDYNYLCAGVFENDISGAMAELLPPVDSAVATRTPRSSWRDQGPLNRRAHAHVGVGQGSRKTVAYYSTQPDASLAADVVVATTTRDDSDSLGQHLPFAGFAIAPAQVLRASRGVYTSRSVIKAGKMLAEALDRVTVARHVAIALCAILERCKLQEREKAEALMTHCGDWRNDDEAARGRLDELFRREAAPLLEADAGLTLDDEAQRDRNSLVRAGFAYEHYEAMKRGDATFELVREATALLESLPRAAAEDEGLRAPLAGFLGNLRAVLTKARETQEPRRIFAGGRAHHTMLSVRGVPNSRAADPLAKADPVYRLSRAYRMLDDAEHAAVAAAALVRLNGLRNGHPERTEFAACLANDEYFRRVAGRGVQQLARPEFLKKKLAALMCTLSEGELEGGAAFGRSRSRLSRACEGEDIPATGDEAYLHTVDADVGVGALERHVMDAVVAAAAAAAAAAAPAAAASRAEETARAIAADFRRFSALAVMRRARNFVLHREAHGVLAAEARSFLVRVTSYLDAPCRLSDDDLLVLDILERLGGRHLVLLGLDVIAGRACEKQIFLRFARDREGAAAPTATTTAATEARRLPQGLEPDLAREPLDTPGIRVDVLDGILALSPPGLEDPLAALVLVRNGLLAVTDAKCLDSSGHIASDEVATNLPPGLDELRAIIGAARTIGPSVVALHPGAISISDPALDRLLGAARLQGLGYAEVTGRVVAAICQTLYYDMNMAYSGGLYGEVCLPEGQRVVISGERAGGRLAPGDEILAGQLKEAARRPQEAATSESVSPNCVYVNSMGASGAAVGRFPGWELRRDAAVQAAATLLTRPGARGERPAVVSFGEATSRPGTLHERYTCVVHLSPTGHRAGAKGVFVAARDDTPEVFLVIRAVPTFRWFIPPEERVTPSGASSSRTPPPPSPSPGAAGASLATERLRASMGFVSQSADFLHFPRLSYFDGADRTAPATTYLTFGVSSCEDFARLRALRDLAINARSIARASVARGPSSFVVVADFNMDYFTPLDLSLLLDLLLEPLLGARPTHRELLLLLLKGRDCIGGSPSGLRSIDFFLEFRIRNGTLRLDVDIDPERALALGFAEHEDGLDHPLVTIPPPHGALPGEGEGAASRPWPVLTTQVLDPDGAGQRARQRRQLAISIADDFPLLFLLIWEYLALLDDFARAVKLLEGAALAGARAHLRRGLVDARFEVLQTLGLDLDQAAARARAEREAEVDMDRAVRITRTRAQLEREAAVAGVPAIIAAEVAREEELLRAAEAADDDEEEGAGPQPGPGQGSPARRRRRRGGGG